MLRGTRDTAEKLKSPAKQMPIRYETKSQALGEAHISSRGSLRSLWTAAKARARDERGVAMAEYLPLLAAIGLR